MGYPVLGTPWSPGEPPERHLERLRAYQGAKQLARHTAACKPSRDLCPVIHSDRFGDLDPRGFQASITQQELQTRRERVMADNKSKPAAADNFAEGNELVAKITVTVTADKVRIALHADEQQKWSTTLVHTQTYKRGAGLGPLEAAEKATQKFTAQLAQLIARGDMEEEL